MWSILGVWFSHYSLVMLFRRSNPLKNLVCLSLYIALTRILSPLSAALYKIVEHFHSLAHSFCINIISHDTFTPHSLFSYPTLLSISNNTTLLRSKYHQLCISHLNMVPVKSMYQRGPYGTCDFTWNTNNCTYYFLLLMHLLLWSMFPMSAPRSCWNWILLFRWLTDSHGQLNL